jgi:hypothetical protein
LGFDHLYEGLAARNIVVCIEFDLHDQSSALDSAGSPEFGVILPQFASCLREPRVTGRKRLVDRRTWRSSAADQKRQGASQSIPETMTRSSTCVHDRWIRRSLWLSRQLAGH